MNKFVQNRTTIDFIAAFRSIAVVPTSFYTTSAACRPTDGDRRRTYPFDPKRESASVGYRGVKLPERAAFALAVRKSLIALTTLGASGKLASE